MKRLIVAGAAFATVCFVAEASVAHADGYALKWATEGYYRARSVFLTNLAPEPRYRIASEPTTNEDIYAPEIRRTSYMMQRLRVSATLTVNKADLKPSGPVVPSGPTPGGGLAPPAPSLSSAKAAKALPLAILHVQLDALDDVLWGDNNGLAIAPLFATDASNQHYLGQVLTEDFRVPRAWVQFQVPVGLMRVGRMSSHWGMGLLANGGGSFNHDPMSPVGYPKRKHLDTFFDDDFGDNHFGTTTDRVLFITRPVTIAKTIMKKKDVKSNLIVGYAYDKLSEAPFLTAEGTDRTFRPFGQQGFISRGRNDDVNQHVVLAVYNNQDINKYRYTDQVTVGVYGVMRRSREGSTNPSDPVLGDPNRDCQGTLVPSPDTFVPCIDTGSSVYIVDLWWKYRMGPWYSEGEIYYIGGETFGGVPFPSSNVLNTAGITGGATRWGYLTDLYDVVLELGHSKGDKDLGDEKLTQRALHPDYNVGLILFEEILREQTSRAFLTFISEENPQGALGLMSFGGVVNANYIYPKLRYRPPMLPGTELVGALLMAWVDTRPTGGVTALFTPAADDSDAGSYLGTEVDLALKASFSGNMTFSLETGYFRYGSAFTGGSNPILPNANGSFTLQTRLAFVW